MMSVKTLDWHKVPEAMTPHQLPQQKQLKMADLDAWSAMPVPMDAARPPYELSSHTCPDARVESPMFCAAEDGREDGGHQLSSEVALAPGVGTMEVGHWSVPG